MTKPSDFSPAEAIEVKDGDDARRSRRTPWILGTVGVCVLVLGWLAVSLQDFGQAMFFVDTAVFLAVACYGFTAAALSRIHAVNRERRLRLNVLVHNMELENMSMRDELTQLFNRRYLFERLERELHTAKSFQRPLAFIAIEIKSLNHVNHTYGYAVGDQLLAAFGQFLMDCTRARDIPARTSGNKFGVILPDASKRRAYTMIERLTQSLAAKPLVEDPALDSTIVTSFGVSGYPWGSDTMDGIVRQAETETAVQPDTSDSNGKGLDQNQELTNEIPAAFRELGEEA